MKLINSLCNWLVIAIISMLPVGINASPIIDTHIHMNVTGNDTDSCQASYTAMFPLVRGLMAKYKIQRSIVMSQPFSGLKFGAPDSCKHYTLMGPSLWQYRKKLLFLGGGASLNPMLMYYADPATITPAARALFKNTAYEILQAGAIGYGEMTAEHFSLLDFSHPYESVSPDHPFLLLLADMAGTFDVPIDLHMEAIPVNNIPLPRWLQRLDDNPQLNTLNPSRLYKNIDKFESLLRHNRKARIVWVHAAWDNSSYRLVGVMKRLLAEHPNLYMSIKQRYRKPYSDSQSAHNNTPPGHPGLRSFNRALGPGDVLKEKWLKLFKEFPDRFMIGQDQHFSNNYGIGAMKRMTTLLSKLPPTLEKMIARENAVNVYKIGTRLICHSGRRMRVDESVVDMHLANGDTLGPC